MKNGPVNLEPIKSRLINAGYLLIPDHHVRLDLEDVLSGREVELEKALELMGSKADGR